MKKGNFGKLKFNMWFYFLIFTVLIIGLIWVIQLVFMENYYSNVKTSEMRNYGELIDVAINNESDIEKPARECRDRGIYVYIYGIEADGEVYVLYNSIEDCDDLLLLDATQNLLRENAEDYIGVYKSGNYKRRGDLYYVSKTDYKGEKAYLILTCSHNGMADVLSVMHILLAVITVVVLVISFILAWYFSSKLSKPIDEMSLTAKKWAEGDNTAVFEVGNSYTEITELADALNYAKEEVSRSGELQRDLLANVSHDLKTPLTMIKAYAEMIKDISGDNKEKREKHTQVIIDEADRLTMLVNDILNLSKLQSSVDDLTMTEINLSELTERVIGRFSDYVENKGYKIEAGIAPDLITIADEKKVEQVIYNLLGNSINYTGEDMTVKVYLTAENDKILLEIIDSGKGISEEAMDTIWERYYRFSETNTRPVKGTGLGLSIVKAILDNHKLEYGVRSKKDCGSNFYVKFNRVRNE